VNESNDENPIFMVDSNSVPVEDLVKPGATKVNVRYLIDERHGSERFALRLYRVERDGHAPLDQHQYEHQVYILSEEGMLRTRDGNNEVLRRIHQGDAIFVPSNAMHQFINEQNEPLVFLCVKGNPMLYTPSAGGSGQLPAGEDPTRNFC